ncbi:MAG: hypothetical protein ABSA84_05860 [Gammaproteobacteria bacterium]|jgi:hypothetical protein
MTTKNRQETDLPWKYILSLYFKPFMELCWQKRATEINWNKKPRFLDKELIKITKDAATGNRVIDKLIEVELIDGNRCCILIHLEVQSTKQADFSKRMFVYRYRLRDVYEKPIASMALLLDDDPSWRPCSYSESLWDSEITMRFPIIKLIDYNEQIQGLEQSTNPFAIIILAQLTALKKQEIELKLTQKLQITRKLYTLNFSKKEVLALFRFIDWIISLPKECEAEYMRNVAKLEKEEFGKNFICPAEQLWLEEGMEKGSAITAQKIAMKMLGKKGISIAYIAKITGISITELRRLKDKKH